MGDTAQGEVTAHRVRRAGRETRAVTFRFPVVDEAIVQFSDVHGAVSGRELTPEEQALARSVFSDSIAYGRVRLILGNLAAGTTAGNNIRLPPDFVLNGKDNKALLIHEMTHVWQFQHFGAGYITTSLLQQAHAAARRGNRNFAYEYQLRAGDSFYHFAPEQQAFIVENYFLMQYDQALLDAPGGAAPAYKSNHLGTDGFPATLTAAERRQEIAAEMPLHAPLIRQVSTMPFLPADELLRRRMRDVMILSPHDHMFPGAEHRLTPTPALFEMRFDWP